MIFLWSQLWQLLLLTCLGGLLQTEVCEGQQLVDIQDGPLYRVKGFPMSISCSVSGLKNSRVQDFAFSVYKPKLPDVQVQIISTNDVHYAYAVYFARVRDKSIVIERRTETSVLFHIKSPNMEDSGKYECYTPNQGPEYLGSYNAFTTLNVIEDTLEASYSGPASHSITEGESLQLDCQVSSQTFQHTHLSVTWYLRGSTDTRPIISLDRDLTVRPGTGFADRYHSGLIAMEKTDDTNYRLKISQIKQSDSGEIYCQADEWIQDPDRSWFRICHRNTTGSNIKVKTLDTAHEGGSFVTEIQLLNEALEEGDLMALQCSIEAQNLPGNFFSMTWLRNNMEVAQIGPSGVLSVASPYAKRANNGELRTVKKGDRIFVLTIQPVRAEDQGMYQCRAVEEEKTETGSFVRGKSQLSLEETVHIRAKESGLAVVMTKQLVNVSEGEALQISCSVSGAKGLLSVSWQHKKSTGSSFSDVITLSHEGVIRDVGPQYQHRSLRTFRSNAADFIFELNEALLSDSGEYMCTVSEWSIESSDNMKKVNSQSQQGQVFVKSIDSLVKVSLKTRKANVIENSVIKMICSVKAPKVALAVTWKFEPRNSNAQQNLIYMDHTGSISYGEEQRDYQLETQVQESGTYFVLKVLRASKRQEGRYGCQIDAYDKNVQKTKKLSNQLAITVGRPVSKLSVSTTLRSGLKVQANSDPVIDCLVTSQTSNSSRFEVTWIHGTQTLLKMDPEGVVTLEMDERISMSKTKRQTFQLMIRQVKSADSGNYICSVQEWIQDPDGIWYSLDTKSVTMELDVFEKESDFSMDKSNVQLEAIEGEQVKLSCSLGPSGLDPTFRYSLSWFFQRQDQSLSTVMLLTYSHEGRLQFQGSEQEFQHRLRFSRPTISDFHLSILNSVPSDSGSYYCQVDQYQADCKSKWERKASDKSGFTNVSVHIIESKLQVHKANRVLLITDIQTGFMVECMISSRSSDKSIFEVTWSRKQTDEQPMTIFTANRDGTLRSSILDRTLVYDRPSTNRYTLTVPNVDASDNGKYQCQVVEWLQTAANTWRKLAEDKSGELSINVKVEIKSSISTFTLETPVTHMNTSEREPLALSCSINFDKVDPTFQYSLTWLVERPGSSASSFLLSHTHNGHLQYQSENQQLIGRLQFSRPSEKTFHLTILNSAPSDSGNYRCRVEQYQLSCEGKWEKRGSPQLVSTMVNVHKIESKLQVNKVSRVYNVSDIQTGFVVDCEIKSRSSDMSVFEVTWSGRQGDERPMTIFTASRDGTLRSAILDRTLVYDRPSTNRYTLTVPNVDASDNGKYQCQVVEWLQTAANTWRKLAEDKSGELSINVKVEIKSSISTFTLETPVTHMNTSEGEPLALSCSINFDKVDPTFQYSLTWLVERPGSSASSFLLSHTHNGHLQYQSENQQLIGRLQFSRPSAKTFHLTILNTDPSDSGNYRCRVEQYQLSCEGKWEKRGSPQLVSTMVNVHKIESKLQVNKVSRVYNVSDIQTGFVVDCEIKSRSSDMSVFEVTWSRRQGGERPMTIFTASRDGTLRSSILDRTLVYDRPSTNRYTLTVPNVVPSDNGKYQCQVAEWLQTAANTWRKLAEDKSGEHSVIVQAKAPLYENECSSGLILGSLIPLLVLLLLVVIWMLIKLQKSRSTLKKQNDSLWVEGTPLKAITETATNEK